MGVIKRKVKGSTYSYYRDKDRKETYLGKPGSEETKEKIVEAQIKETKKELGVLGRKLEDLEQKLAANFSAGAPIKVDEAGLPVNQILKGDSYDLLSKFKDNTIHFAVTSPPYNLGLPYDVYDDKKEYSDYRDYLKKVWKETFRIMVDGGRFALNIAPTGIADFKQVHFDLVNDVQNVGFTFRAEIVWYKQNMGRHTAWGSWKSPSNPHIVPSWEYVYVFHKNSPKLPGVKSDIDISPEEFIEASDAFWRIQPETKRNGHPAPFPELLIERLLKFYTYRGNICLDMFGGTGTVAVVAAKNYRKYISIDISKEYCEIAQKRVNETTKVLMPMGASK